jgi:ribose transport system substrate-binding protein
MVIWPLIAFLVAGVIYYRQSVYQKPAPLPAPKVAFVTGGSGPYWQLTVDGAKAAAAKHNVELFVEMPSDDENLEQQMVILSKLDLNKVEGIAISPLDAEGQTDLINQFVRREKKVVTFDSDAPLSTRQSHVGASNFAAGRICARMVNEAMPDGGKIAVLAASLTKDNILDRKSGFQERVAQMADDVPQGSPPKYVVVGYLVDDGNRTKCQENIRNVLSEHADLGAIVGLNARHGPILLSVLKELDKLGSVKLVTFDDADETLKGIEDGYIYATLAQDPYRYGYEAVTTLAMLCSGDETSLPIVGRGSTYLSTEAIRRDNLEDFRSKLKSRQEKATSADAAKKSA